MILTVFSIQIQNPAFRNCTSNDDVVFDDDYYDGDDDN